MAEPPAIDDLQRKVWTREELYALMDAGLLDGCRYELIEGEVYNKLGQRPVHAAAIARLNGLLVGLFSAERISIQLPVEPANWEAMHSMPEPDVAVLRGPRSRYSHPGPDDVLLLIEVADASARFDLGRKANLYARAGYAEYVVVNLSANQVHVFRDAEDGIYKSSTILMPGQEWSPLAAPNARISVSQLLTGE